MAAEVPAVAPDPEVPGGTGRRSRPGLALKNRYFLKGFELKIDDFSIPIIFTHTVMALRVTACLMMKKNYRHLVDLPAYLSCQDPR